MLNRFYTNGVFHKTTYNRIDYRLQFPKKYCISFLKSVFVLASNEYPDEMLHYVAFHLGLHYLQKNQFSGFGFPNGLIMTSHIKEVLSGFIQLFIKNQVGI